jgi:glycosyltransferase involved in cell wall biosynthesis
MLAAMRIGAIGEPSLSATNYRSYYPVSALARRGHEAVYSDHRTGLLSLREASACDVVLVFRRHDLPVLKLMRTLAERGVGVVWDNDDDFRNIPRSVARQRSGPKGRQLFQATVSIARAADAVTVTTDALRAAYLEAGVPDVQVIENYTWHKGRRRRRRHTGLVVGWVAGVEHAGDADALGIAGALGRLQAEHPDLHVECLGVDLHLAERYAHRSHVHFDALPEVMAGWDIAIAPIAPTPFNAARSNIKVKEYAASRLPWLASDFGPYRGLGEAQGGRLVPDDGWYDALAALIGDQGARKRLSKAGRSWAKGQTIDAVAERYEALFALAAERAAARRPEGRRAVLTTR